MFNLSFCVSFWHMCQHKYLIFHFIVGTQLYCTHSYDTRALNLVALNKHVNNLKAFKFKILCVNSETLLKKFSNPTDNTLKRIFFWLCRCHSLSSVDLLVISVWLKNQSQPRLFVNSFDKRDLRRHLCR